MAGVVVNAEPDGSATTIVPFPIASTDPKGPATTTVPLSITNAVPDNVTLSITSSDTAPGPTLSIINIAPDPTTLSASTINIVPDVTATSTAVNNAVTPETYKLLTLAMGQTSITSSIDSTSSSSSSSNSTSSSSSSDNPARAIMEGVTSATIIMALIVFCVIRYKRYNKTSRSASAHETSTSCDVLDKCRPQSTQFCPTPRPFLDFSKVENSSPSKGIFLPRARNLLAKSDEEAIDPFKDPSHLEEGLSTNDDEDRRIGYTLDHLETFTNRFEEELRQLGAMAQSGRLSAENRVRLEEIRHNAGPLMMPCHSRRDQPSVARNPSSGSSSSLPSYRTCGG